MTAIRPSSDPRSWVAAGTASSRATGLIRVAALTYAVGQTDLADLYTYANFAPNLVFELVIGGALSATLVPAFVKARNDPVDTVDNEDDAASALLSTGLVASIGLALAALVVTFAGHQIVTAIVSGNAITAREQADEARLAPADQGRRQPAVPHAPPDPLLRDLEPGHRLPERRAALPGRRVRPGADQPLHHRRVRRRGRRAPGRTSVLDVDRMHASPRCCGSASARPAGSSP